MGLNIAKEEASLQKLTTKELRLRYEEAFNEACTSNNRIWLVRRVLWRIQATAEGDLSQRARQRATELANDADLRMQAPREAPAVVAAPARKTVAPTDQDSRLPPPGSVLVKQHKGREIQVTVLDGGFEWEGEQYATLSAVAKAITGTHTNGFLFFRLQNGGRT